MKRVWLVKSYSREPGYKKSNFTQLEGGFSSEQAAQAFINNEVEEYDQKEEDFIITELEIND